MADEIALNLMKGQNEDWDAFMFTRSTGYSSGRRRRLEEAFRKAVIENQNFGRLDYYEGRPYLPIAGKSLIKWSEE